MKIKSNPAVQTLINNYPEYVVAKLIYIRKIILEAASEIEEIKELEETLKWGEPSYLVKKGSTVRMAWKKSTPNQYAVYFKCTSKLVDTFKEVYGDLFKYEGSRAIVFQMDDEVSAKELKHCISLALSYHRVKHLPLLGASLLDKV